MLVGGMPQSVVQFVETRDFSASDDAKREILALYRKDISKARASDVAKILDIFDSLPNQQIANHKGDNRLPAEPAVEANGFQDISSVRA